MAQRGFSLIELMTAVGVIAIALCAAIPLASGNAAGSASSGALQFDSTIAKAQSVASSSGNGASVQFLPSAGGFVMRVYSGRPNGGIIIRYGPDVGAPGTITERTLGKPPFAIFFDSSGHASGISGTFDPSATIASDPGCPAPPSVQFTIGDSRAQFSRTLPCLQ